MSKKLDDDNAKGMGRLSPDEKEKFRPKYSILQKRNEEHKKRLKAVSKKLSKHSSLYSVGKSFYRIYCDITGPLHSLPDFLIIGASRSGGTTLYENLTQHPNILSAAFMEILFFEDQYHKGIGWYRGHFPHIWKKYTKFKKKKLTGEASPRYFVSPRTPMRIAKLIPDVKLIIILRDPIDRVYSQYQQKVAQGDETRSFDEIVDCGIADGEIKAKNAFERMKKDSNYYTLDYNLRAYLTHSRYVEHIEYWMKYFPKNQFLILDSKEFNESPNKIFEKVFDFLNLPKFTNIDYSKYNSRKYDDMKSSTRKKLIEYFKPYNVRLYKLLGKEFDWDK
jgi:hypothetical protein